METDNHVDHIESKEKQRTMMKKIREVRGYADKLPRKLKNNK